MMEYYLELVGLRTLLRTPDAITISENLRPFLCQPCAAVDCTITLQTGVNLPERLPDGLWNGPEYYDRHLGAQRVFHCDEEDGNAFAVTEAFENGNITISVLPEYLSYFTGSTGIFNRIGLETLLLQYRGVLLHASLIKYNDKTIAFAGPSGVGKSTQAGIWEACLGASVLNGDRAALRKQSDGWVAYGCPYAGTSGIYQKDSAPLAAVLVLAQAKENTLRRLTAGEGIRYLYPELSVHHWDRSFVEKATDLCLQLLAEVPVYLLECRPEESAALLVKKGLGL